MAAAYVVSAIASAFGKSAMLNPGKMREIYHPDWVARHNLLNDHSDWRPSICFADGFAGTLQWYRDHQWLPDANAKARKHDNADCSETTV